MEPKLTELIDRAPWREAVTYRDTCPHEYVPLHKDAQDELFNAIGERFRNGEGVACRFFRMDNTYLTLQSPWVNTRIQLPLVECAAKLQTPLYRLRDQLLSQLLHHAQANSSRPGIVAFRWNEL